MVFLIMLIMYLKYVFLFLQEEDIILTALELNNFLQKKQVMEVMEVTLHHKKYKEISFNVELISLTSYNEIEYISKKNFLDWLVDNKQLFNKNAKKLQVQYGVVGYTGFMQQGIIEFTQVKYRNKTYLVMLLCNMDLYTLLLRYNLFSEAKGLLTNNDFILSVNEPIGKKITAYRTVVINMKDVIIIYNSLIKGLLVDNAYTVMAVYENFENKPMKHREGFVIKILHSDDYSGTGLGSKFKIDPKLLTKHSSDIKDIDQQELAKFRKKDINRKSNSSKNPLALIWDPNPVKKNK